MLKRCTLIRMLFQKTYLHHFPRPVSLNISDPYTNDSNLIDQVNTIQMGCQGRIIIEPWHDKTNKVTVRPAKTQISLGICPVWSESSLSAWRQLGPLTTHWAHSKDSDQTGPMPRLIRVLVGRTLILLILSCRISFVNREIWVPGKWYYC